MDITAIIVDDEASSRNTLRNYVLQYCPGVSIVGESQNIVEAKQQIHNLQPQLVFLDIEMPFGNAFDLIDQLDQINFETIFVTAYSEYAIQAINLSHCSYLLKPVAIEDLIKAVEQAKENLQFHQKFKSAEILLENLGTDKKQQKKMVLPTIEGFEVVTLKDIVRCEGNDNLTDLYLESGAKKTVCKTLKHFEEALNNYDFLRTHKSHLVNLHFVKSFQKGKTGTIVLEGGKEIPLSASRKEPFLNWFKL